MYGFIFYYLLPLIIIFIKKRIFNLIFIIKKLKYIIFIITKVKIPIIKKILNFWGPWPPLPPLSSTTDLVTKLTIKYNYLNNFGY